MVRWEVYCKLGEIVLVIVVFLVVGWGWWVWRERKKRRGYMGVFGGENILFFGEVRGREGFRDKCLVVDLEVGDFDENELDDLYMRMLMMVMGGEGNDFRYSVGVVSEDSEDEEDVKGKGKEKMLG